MRLLSPRAREDAEWREPTLPNKNDAPDAPVLAEVTESADLVICPVCHRSTPTSTALCIYCWAKRGEYEAVGEVDTERYRAIERSSEEREHRRVRIRKNARYVVAALVLVLVAWWGYSTFVASPSPLPLPASTARSIEASPATWSAAGGGIGRTRSTEASVSIEGAEAWSIAFDGRVSTELVVGEERLYVALDDRRLVALSTETGEVVWERGYEQHLTVSPVIAGDLLYVVSGRNPNPSILQALEPATGEVRWESTIGPQMYGSPLVDRGTIYVVAQNAMFGFDAEDGDRLWRRDIDTDWAFIDRPFLSPVLGDDYLVVSTDQRALFFDRVTGVEAYWWDFQSFPEHLVMGDDGLVYGISHRLVAAIDPDSSRPWWDGVRGAWSQFWIWGMAPEVPPPPHKWARGNPPSTILAPAVDGERVYMAGRRGDVRALDQATGQTLWEREGGAYVDGPISTATGLLLADDDTLVLLDAETGAELATRSFDGGSIMRVTPTDHGTYVAIDDGSILALR